MKLLFTILFSVFTTFIFSQNTIDWSSQYQLQLSDFKSPATQIGSVNIYSLFSGASLDFSFYMTNAEFMFTKNFNLKVNCSFNRDGASLVAPDSLFAFEFLNFARFHFDLTELYARKFRKKLFEEKGAFSDVNFFRPIYDQIQQELITRHSNAVKLTDLGRNKEKLLELHNEVLQEIEVLSEFCKNCKPSKKKK
jgi:hypothetical protein